MDFPTAGVKALTGEPIQSWRLAYKRAYRTFSSGINQTFSLLFPYIQHLTRSSPHPIYAPECSGLVLFLHHPQYFALPKKIRLNSVKYTIW